jgi:hypothetical protein
MCKCLLQTTLSGNALIAHLLEVEHVVPATWFTARQNGSYWALCAPDGIWTMLSNNGYATRPFHISLGPKSPTPEFIQRLQYCRILIGGLERNTSSIVQKHRDSRLAQTICLSVRLERVEWSPLTDAEFDGVLNSLERHPHVQIYQQANSVAVPHELFEIHLRLLRQYGIRLDAPYIADQGARWDYERMVASLDIRLASEKGLKDANEVKKRFKAMQDALAAAKAAKAATMLAETRAAAKAALNSFITSCMCASNARVESVRAAGAVARAKAVRRAGILEDAARAGRMAASASSSRLNASLAVESALMSVARAQAVRAARLAAAARRKAERRRAARQRAAIREAAAREAARREAARLEAARRDAARLEVAAAISFVLNRIRHPPVLTCPPKSRRQAGLRHEVRGHHFTQPKLHTSTKRGTHNSHSLR